ncbi:MAG: MMPL family transporter [Clostridiales bacterium]|nr:MMPL family transporter [Clostridiales bacterium]
MNKIAKFIVEKRILFFVLFAGMIVYCVFCIPRVNVEYSISAYLPAGTDTQRALAIMDDEFVTNGSTKIMVKGVKSFDDAQKLYEKLRAVDGVSTMTFAFENTEAYYKDNAALFTIPYDGDAESDRVKKANADVLKILDESGYDYVIPTPLGTDYAATLAHEVVIILFIAAAVIIAVLLFTSKSFAEVIAFPIVFVVAAALNMGTNYWLGTISFVSNTVCIILQLALAIDYSIILCHRFTEEKDRTKGDAKTAMINALTAAIPEISSSSLTTVSGLVALMFMQLRLGFDLGLVLAKSIICSLITVFLLMPGILLLLSKAMDKTRHRNLVPKLRFWGKGIVKARYVLIPVFVALFAVGATLVQNIDYVYSRDIIDTPRPPDYVVATRECDEVFGYDNVFAVLVPKGDYDIQRRILDEVEKDPLVNSATGLANVKYGDKYLIDEITPIEFSYIANISGLQAAVLFSMYVNSSGNDEPRLIDILHYLIENKDNALISGSADMIDTIESLLSQLEGENYSRLVFTFGAPVESKETFEMIERLDKTIKEICPEAICAGESMTSYDLNASFSYDNTLITLLTVVFIFAILMITFRSPLIPIVLVAVIQGAIFINFSLNVIFGNNLFFFTYLIISAIQMGATIDYAILLTNRFRQNKQSMGKREAMITAVSGAFPTVFTSGIIMCVAGFLVGGLTSDTMIASMGTALGTGTLVSIVAVLVFLPALLYVLDPILEKSVIGGKKKGNGMRLPNPSDIPYYSDARDI